MKEIYRDINEKLTGLGIDCRADAPMSEYTSFKVGGPAALLVSPKDEAELSAVLAICSGRGITPFILGNGSNLLVSDEGIDNVCVRLASAFEKIEYKGDGVIRCTAGATLAHLCVFALEHSLTGLEFAYGIPGTAGGAAFMNAGAYGGEMKDVLAKCSHMALSDGSAGEFSGEELRLGYRSSVYSDGGYVITGLTLKLRPGNREEIDGKMRELIGRRIDKQPLDMPSAGSFFKRPPGNYAGALIEQCGMKGFRTGGAQVSEKHAGFVVNAGGATCADILSLGKKVADEVRKQTGITLEREVRYIG